jgi:hypothetical protein
LAAVTDYAPPAVEKFGYPAVDASTLYVPTDAYVVLTLAQEDRIRPSDQKLVPTIAVSFAVPGLPGVFTIRIDNYAFTHANVLEYMQERSWLIRSLYALPARLPDFVPLGGYATGVVISLDSVSGVHDAAGVGAVAWAGGIFPRGVSASARLEVTALGDAEPSLVSDPIAVAASDATVPLSGTTGPLDPGRYTAQLTAESSLGIGLSPSRGFSIL